MKAINNYVIFEAIEDEKKTSVIILDEVVRKSKGKVISAGNKCQNVSENDIILIPRFSDDFIIEGKTYSVSKEEDICAIF